MTNDKQRGWREELALNLADESSIQTYMKDSDCRVVTGNLRFKEPYTNNLRRVYRVTESFIEDLLDKTRKEVADNIIDSIRKLPLVVVGDSEATKQQIVEDIKDKYLKD